MRKETLIRLDPTTPWWCFTSTLALTTLVTLHSQLPIRPFLFGAVLPLISYPLTAAALRSEKSAPLLGLKSLALLTVLRTLAAPSPAATTSFLLGCTPSLLLLILLLLV